MVKDETNGKDFALLVYIIALIESLAYLASVPVCAAFYARVTDGAHFGVGLSFFRSGAALRKARRGGRFPVSRASASGPDLPRLWRSVRRLRVEAIVLRGCLSLGDAAATAVVCGALTALAATLSLRADEAIIDLKPEFHSDGPRVELQGMIRARMGQIISAAARGELTIARERIAQWTGTRLKALWPPPWKTSAT